VHRHLVEVVEQVPEAADAARHRRRIDVPAEGSYRLHELRLDELETRFPGVVRSILAVGRA
jgi:hypothetical protein